jgi:hypothetical protein
MNYIPVHGSRGHFLISNKSVITCKKKIASHEQNKIIAKIRIN